MYLFWSPQDVGTDGPHNRVSRFTYDEATRTISAASEEKVLVIPTQRETCCHAGGDMVFDGDDNLVIVTGDNTNPFESAGYAPLDERAGRTSYDAQRTSANTNDLRGKVLRIHPEDDGTYTIPEGNMFAPGTDKTKPEIFAMGFRNPFRIGVDQKTGNVLVGDYGPDAQNANPSRGPGTPSSGTSSRSRASTGGRTAPVTTRRTSTTTSRPASPARRSTAPTGP